MLRRQLQQVRVRYCHPEIVRCRQEADPEVAVELRALSVPWWARSHLLLQRCLQQAHYRLYTCSLVSLNSQHCTMLATNDETSLLAWAFLLFAMLLLSVPLH